LRHTPLDHHARRSSYFGLEPRLKIAGTVAFIVCASIMSTLRPLLFAFTFTLLLAALSGVPAAHYLKRYAIAFPFILFPALSAWWVSGPEVFVIFFLRISTCVLPLLVLSSTTPFFDLVTALRRLGMPSALTIMLTFLYRYAFLFTGELERMVRGRRARGFRGGTSIFSKRSRTAFSATVGMVLVRAHGRGVRVYDALTMRGYSGETRSLNRWKADGPSAAFTATLAAFGTFLVLLDWGWLPVAA